MHVAFVALSYKEKYIKGFYKKMLNACGFCGLSYKEKYIKSFFFIKKVISEGINQ